MRKLALLELVTCYCCNLTRKFEICKTDNLFRTFYSGNFMTKHISCRLNCVVNHGNCLPLFSAVTILNVTNCSVV